MSVTACRSVLLPPILPSSNGLMSGMIKAAGVEVPQSLKLEIGKEEEDESQRFDIWSSIPKNKEQFAAAAIPPYIHPLVRQSSSMSQESLEICTESLGSETGSYELSSSDELDSSSKAVTEVEDDLTQVEEEEHKEMGMSDRSYVNYHCCIGRRSPVRSFPPPLPSISRRNGLCLKMQHHRHNGRLVLEAMPVQSCNYLHAERHGGRLLLSFIDNSTRTNSPAPTSTVLLSAEEEVLRETEEEDVIEVEEEKEEEELEVVDRGSTVEVKVSTQAQAVSGAAMAKIHRSSLVINKFVVGSPLPEQGSPAMTGKKMNIAPTTAAAAAVVASSISTLSSTTEGFQYNYLQQHHESRWGSQSPAAAATADAKLLFTSKGRSREELLHDMRRCSELRRPLFIFEQPCCIATS